MRHCYVLDVFTLDGAGGNPLGVVPDSVGLGDDDMQRIAADLGFSETVFIFWEENRMPLLRIFTPAVELPFAGHPLVGTAWLLQQQFPAIDRVECGIGQVAIGTAPTNVTWVQPPPRAPVVAELDEAEPIGEAVGVTGATRAFDARVPMHNLYLEVPTATDVAGAAPDLQAVADQYDGLYLYAFEPGEGPHRADPGAAIAPLSSWSVIEASKPLTASARSRYFAPRLGVDEDPATGSAAVGFAEVFIELGEEVGHITILQGTTHLSLIDVRWGDGAIRLAGQVEKREVRELED